MNQSKIGIVVLVHNAKEYVQKCIESIKKYTKNIPYYLIVIDNGSNTITKELLSNYYTTNTIDILCSLESNRFFSKANNIGAKIVPENCTHILLLNSDVEVMHTDWLLNLLSNHEKGITSYGACIGNLIDGQTIPDRADGYCFLIDKELYYQFYLDEYFPWFWSITKLQALVLNKNYSVKAIADHSNYIIHYGGRSGGILKNLSQSINIDREQVMSWFGEKRIEIL